MKANITAVLTRKNRRRWPRGLIFDGDDIGRAGSDPGSVGFSPRVERGKSGQGGIARVELIELRFPTRELGFGLLEFKKAALGLNRQPGVKENEKTDAEERAGDSEGEGGSAGLEANGTHEARSSTRSF